MRFHGSGAQTFSIRRQCGKYFRLSGAKELSVSGFPQMLKRLLPPEINNPGKIN